MRNLIAVVMVVGACVEPDVEHSDDSTPLERRTSECVTVDNRSLVESDPAIVTEERFGLARVLEQIRSTTPGGVSVPCLRDMFGELYQAYSVCAGDGVDPKGFGLRCRPEVAQLAALDPFTDDPDGLHFKPVAVANRFDLATKDSKSCGESRIVYWKVRGPTTGRAGFIVELFTPPVIKRGRRSCEPIARFWASLSAEDDPQVRARMLERFFYEGLPGMPFPPISARGAGWDGGPGQIRANSFVDSVQWHLREAKWQKRCDAAGCRAGFYLVDSKNSPAASLFAGTHPDAAAFQRWFVRKAVRRLARATDANDLSLGNADAFNAYEAISQPFADDPNSVAYARVASAGFRSKIAAKLADLGSPLSVDNILDRATAVTCAGCHRVSRSADLGGGLVFPPVGFVQIDEQGQLSAALVDVFLPKRRAILQEAVCGCPGGTSSISAEGETLGGKAMHEPN